MPYFGVGGLLAHALMAHAVMEHALMAHLVPMSHCYKYGHNVAFGEVVVR
jgi:hypothetical protein